MQTQLKNLRKASSASRPAATARQTVARVSAIAAGAKPTASGAALKPLPLEQARENARAQMNWFRVPPKVYFKGGCLEVALAELAGKRRAMIVTDKDLLDLGFVDRVTRILDQLNIQFMTFYHVGNNPLRSSVEHGLREMKEFKPDAVIALGGGSPIDAAKAMWYMYEKGQSFEQLVTSSQQARRDVGEVTAISNTLMICVPTTSGTGAEVVPFASVTDDTTGRKFTLADYALTPSMAIVDPQLVINLPRHQTAYGGMTTLAHALESYISVFQSDYSRGLSKHALTMMSRYFARAYKGGSMDMHAREKMHNAATVAGFAFSNTYLGVCHSLASELASVHGVNAGLAKGLLIVPVLRFMAQDQGTLADLAELADHLKLGGTSAEEKCEKVVDWVKAQKAAADIPHSIKDVLGAGQEKAFTASLDALIEGALADAHFMASPVQPTADQLKTLLKAAWTGAQ